MTVLLTVSYMLALETRFLPVMLGILIQTENAIQSNYWRHHKTVKVIKSKSTELNNEKVRDIGRKKQTTENSEGDLK